VDRLFREKYEMTQRGDFEQIALCLVGTALWWDSDELPRSKQATG